MSCVRVAPNDSEVLRPVAVRVRLLTRDRVAAESVPLFRDRDPRGVLDSSGDAVGTAVPVRPRVGVPCDAVRVRVADSCARERVPAIDGDRAPVAERVAAVAVTVAADWVLGEPVAVPIGRDTLVVADRGRETEGVPERERLRVWPDAVCVADRVAVTLGVRLIA